MAVNLKFTHCCCEVLKISFLPEQVPIYYPPEVRPYTGRGDTVVGVVGVRDDSMTLSTQNPKP